MKGITWKKVELNKEGRFCDPGIFVSEPSGVKAMFLTEYDKEREFELLRREERREASRETECYVREEVAKDMLKKNYPLDAIKDISKLSEAAIRKLAKSIGVAVL